MTKADNSWKSLRQRASNSDPQVVDEPIDIIDALRKVRKLIGQYGLKVPLEQRFIRHSTLEDLRKSGATVAGVGLGLFHKRIRPKTHQRNG